MPSDCSIDLTCKDGSLFANPVLPRRRIIGPTVLLHGFVASCFNEPPDGLLPPVFEIQEGSVTVELPASHVLGHGQEQNTLLSLQPISFGNGQKVRAPGNEGAFRLAFVRPDERLEANPIVPAPRLESGVDNAIIPYGKDRIFAPELVR